MNWQRKEYDGLVGVVPAATSRAICGLKGVCFSINVRFPNLHDQCLQVPINFPEGCIRD
jgi:hypothetical protein